MGSEMCIRDSIDVGFQTGVGVEDLLADAALDGRLDFGFGAGCEAGREGEVVRTWVVGMRFSIRTNSFLNMMMVLYWSHPLICCMSW